MPHPNVDPIVAGVAGRLGHLRAELERLDDAIDRTGDRWLADQAAIIRGRIDAIDDHLEAVAVEAGDLVAQPPTGPTIAADGELAADLAERARVAAIDAARGLVDVELADLPVDAQATWARMARPVLAELADAAGAAAGPLEVRRAVGAVIAEDRGVSGPEAIAGAVVDAIFGRAR